MFIDFDHLIIVSLIPSPETAEIDNRNFRFFDLELKKLVAKLVVEHPTSQFSYLNLTKAFLNDGKVMLNVYM